MPNADPHASWPAPSGPPTGGRPDDRDGDGAIAPRSTGAPTRRWATVGGLGAGLIGGVTAGLMFGVPGLGGASDAPSLGGAVPAHTNEQPPADEPVGEQGSTTDDGDREARQQERRVAAEERVREDLRPLVEDGTLDADQADAVAERLAAELPSRPGGRDHGHGPMGREIVVMDGERGDRIGERMEIRSERMDELADALDLEREDLVDRLLDGESLADVAEVQGIDPDVLVDVLVAEPVERLEEAVADGELDAAEAADRTAALEELATAHLNGDHPAGPRSHGEPRGTEDDAPADDGAD